MRLLTLLVPFVVACGSKNPVEKCDIPGIDCCTEDIDCLEFYGVEFKRCIDPGDFGVCAECSSTADCDSLYGPGYDCVLDEVVGALCLEQ